MHEILVGRKVHLQGRALNGSELCDLHKLDKPQESLYSFHQLTLRSSSRWTLEPEPLHAASQAALRRRIEAVEKT